MFHQRITRLCLVAIVGILMIAAPKVSQATTITSISVAFGSTVFCDTTQSCSNKIWNLGGGVDIGNVPGKALILTQNQAGTGGFNFDTSDLLYTGTPTITINGTIVFSDDKKTLSQPNGADPLTTTHQESVDWTSPTNNTSGGIQIWLGYADTAHSDPCSDADHNCLPENPWQGSANTTFLGNPVSTAPNAGCDRPNTPSCFDAGAIRIESINTPEPSALLLFGTGLLATIFLIRKNAKKSIRA
jgi:hypothetical protein